MNNKILIVDGDKPEADKLQKTLSESKEGYITFFAKNNDSAIAIANKEVPDVILINIGAGNHKKYDFIKDFTRHEILNETPIIFLIENKTPDDFQITFKEGLMDFIKKPFHTDELILRIKKSIGSHLLLNDIKKRIHQSESEWNRLSNNMALILENTQNSFFIINPEGEIEWANEGFTILHGCDLIEYKKRYGSTIFSFNNDPGIITKFNNALTKKESVNFIYKNISLKTREESWLQVYVSPQINENKEIDKLIGIETDITKIKKKEEELHSQNLKMQAVTENLEKLNSLLEEQKKEVSDKHALLEREQEKSEKLLLNILPFEMARQLKVKGKAKTRYYRIVTIMFADFKGFSKISKTLEPKDLVNILDSYFAKFDDIAEKHFLEKIKTIGDAYMCAGGLPLSNRSNPINTLLAGLEIQNFMNELNDARVLKNSTVWELRIGINTGSVVAGVVGKKKFAYDIWGDAVNIAARMEESGHVGMVNISGSTYEYIKDYFECECRGKIETKHMGKIDMYFVNRIIPELSADPFGVIPNDKFLNIINKL